MAAFAHNPGVYHKYSIAAYPRKAEMGGGYRGVILNKDTKEKKESPVFDTLSAATYWAKKAAHDAAGSSLADIAAMRVKGEYRANVWVKVEAQGNPDSRRARALKEAQQLYRVRKDSTGRALTASEIAANQQRAARLIASMPNPMNDTKRTELRLKQDFLIMLIDMLKFPSNLPITEGGPSADSMRRTIYPEWESYINVQLKDLSKEARVGLPDFKMLATRKKKNPEGVNETDNTDSIAELAFSKGLEMGRELSEMESGESGSGEVVAVSNPSQWLKLYSGLSFNQAESRVKKIKGDEAKLRKVGGMGNYSNVEARLVFEGPGRKEYGVFVSPLRRNPESAASELYESFHGAPPMEVLEYHSQEHEHANYAGLGDLIELKVITPFGKEATITSADPSSAPLQDVVKLCSNEDGTQLYFIGGDQGIDTKALGFKEKDEKDYMVLGVLIELTYRTAKHFHKFKLTDYYHQLGEETGEQPMLLYYPRNPSIAVAGGAYEIKPEGITN